MPRVITALTVLCLLLLPSQALAGSTNSILKDCIDGKLNGHYSQSEINKAKKNMPDDIAEYTNCLDALDSGGTDSLPSNPQQEVKTKSLGINPAKVDAAPKFQGRLAKATKKGERPLKLNGTPVVAGSASPVFTRSGFIFDIPWQVAVLMALIALSLLGAGIYTLYQRGVLDKIGRLFGR